MAPSELSVLLVAASSVDLTWSDNSSDETAFVIEMRPTGGVWESVATAPADATTASVNDLPADTTLDFRVRAERRSISVTAQQRGHHNNSASQHRARDPSRLSPPARRASSSPGQQGSPATAGKQQHSWQLIPGLLTAIGSRSPRSSRSLAGLSPRA